ncbi:hypothetical protein GCM10020255_108840 [Rhodococcus baikonurensis]
MVFDERVVAMAIAEVDAELAVLFNEAGGESAPAYERVKNLVVSQINSGRWAEGDQLPSENQLVSALGLSRMTINRALRELTSDGLIVRMMGSVLLSPPPRPRPRCSKSRTSPTRFSAAATVIEPRSSSFVRKKPTTGRRFFVNRWANGCSIR